MRSIISGVASIPALRRYIVEPGKAEIRNAVTVYLVEFRIPLFAVIIAVQPPLYVLRVLGDPDRSGVRFGGSCLARLLAPAACHQDGRQD